jgi:hypothetical protein
MRLGRLAEAAALLDEPLWWPTSTRWFVSRVFWHGVADYSFDGFCQ